MRNDFLATEKFFHYIKIQKKSMPSKQWKERIEKNIRNIILKEDGSVLQVNWKKICFYHPNDYPHSLKKKKKLFQPPYNNWHRNITINNHDLHSCWWDDFFSSFITCLILIPQTKNKKDRKKNCHNIHIVFM